MQTYTKRALVLAVAVASGGCFLMDQSNEVELGRVEVNALLVADTCGPGTVSAGPSMEYEVELRRNGSTLLWDGPGGTVRGTFLSGDEFCIELARSWHVRDPDPWFDDPGCDMSQIERLCGTLELVEGDASQMETERVTSLTARHEAFVSHDTGSVCTELVGISEGQYLTLPCQVVYDLEGMAAD